MKRIGPPAQPRSSAFPNAYISTDELPKRSWVKTGLSVFSAVGVSYLGLVILVLSLLSTEYNPVTQVASDYGVGVWAPEMNAGFLLAGIGVLCLALLTYPIAKEWKGRVGSVLLVPAAFALAVNAFYQTDVEGAARTFHGTVHGAGGAVFFFTAPVALLLITHGLGRRRFTLTLVAFAVAVLVLAFNGLLALDVGGFAERVLILVVFTSMILTSIQALKGT